MEWYGFIPIQNTVSCASGVCFTPVPPWTGRVSLPPAGTRVAGPAHAMPGALKTPRPFMACALSRYVWAATLPLGLCSGGNSPQYACACHSPKLGSMDEWMSRRSFMEGSHHAADGLGSPNVS